MELRLAGLREAANKENGKLAAALRAAEAKLVTAEKGQASELDRRERAAAVSAVRVGELQSTAAELRLSLNETEREREVLKAEAARHEAASARQRVEIGRLAEGMDAIGAEASLLRSQLSALERERDAARAEARTHRAVAAAAQAGASHWEALALEGKDESEALRATLAACAASEHQKASRVALAEARARRADELACKVDSLSAECGVATSAHDGLAAELAASQRAERSAARAHAKARGAVERQREFLRDLRDSYAELLSYYRQSEELRADAEQRAQAQRHSFSTRRRSEPTLLSRRSLPAAARGVVPRVDPDLALRSLDSQLAHSLTSLTDDSGRGSVSGGDGGAWEERGSGSSLPLRVCLPVSSLPGLGAAPPWQEAGATGAAREEGGRGYAPEYSPSLPSAPPSPLQMDLRDVNRMNLRDLSLAPSSPLQFANDSAAKDYYSRREREARGEEEEGLSGCGDEDPARLSLELRARLELLERERSASPDVGSLMAATRRQH